MQEKIFKELDGDALMQALQDTAYSTENAQVERTLTPEQKKQFAERQSALAERKTEIEDNIREYLTPLKEEVKSIDDERKEIGRTTKKGYITSNEKLFWMQDFETKTMIAYDGSGELVKTRRMKQEERQMMVLSSEKIVSKIG